MLTSNNIRGLTRQLLLLLLLAAMCSSVRAQAATLLRARDRAGIEAWLASSAPS